MQAGENIAFGGGKFDSAIVASFRIPLQAGFRKGNKFHTRRVVKRQNEAVLFDRA
jgi:hypothetical protein